jgi:hypothetical protein
MLGNFATGCHLKMPFSERGNNLFTPLRARFEGGLLRRKEQERHSQ